MRILLLVPLVCLFTMINFNLASQASTIHVPQDYPFIQDAVYAAQSGDTIQVAAGTYFENLIIDKSIQLSGEDRETTILDGGGNGTVIDVYHDGLVLNGFTIKNSGSGWPNSGVLFNGTDNNEVFNNKLRDNFIAVHLSDSSNNTISDNIIENNELQGLGMFAYATPCTDNQIMGNHFDNHLNKALYIFNSDNFVISDNLFDTNAIGIEVDQSHYSDILNNYILDSQWGIKLLSSSATINICGNTLFGMDHDGIHLYANACTVIQNYIDNCNDNGIRVSGNGNTVRENIILNCSYGSLCLGEDAANNHIYHNSLFAKAKVSLMNNKYNYWDNGYPSGGNYWFDYTGVDRNGDGIGDTSYTIKVNHVDQYPLMLSVHTILYNVINLDTAEAFFTIQHAIDDSDTLDGHTIFVSSGSYGGPIVLSKSIHLQGEDKGTTFIHGAELAAIAVEKPGCSIKNFTITSHSLVEGMGIGLYADNNTISNNIIKNFKKEGIFISSNNMVYDNEILNCCYGINFFHENNYNTVINNSILNSENVSIRVYRSSYNVISNNHCEMTNIGIGAFRDCYYNLISNNDIVNMIYGIYLNDNTIYNSVFNNSMRVITESGLIIDVGCDKNVIWRNSFSGILGPALSIHSNENQIYSNNIENLSGSDLYIDPSTSLNVVAGPYPIGGNYYIAYSGMDNYSGPDQDQPGSDGIGDSPYMVGGGEIDPYPLMTPFQGLSVDVPYLSSIAGGVIQFSLDAGDYHGNKNYVILGGASHVLPGTALPGSALILPFNWDRFTDMMFPYLNSPLFQNFLGTLDINGSATAFLQTSPVPPEAVGLTLTFTYMLYQTYDVVSNPVLVTVIP